MHLSIIVRFSNVNLCDHVRFQTIVRIAGFTVLLDILWRMKPFSKKGKKKDADILFQGNAINKQFLENKVNFLTPTFYYLWQKLRFTAVAKGFSQSVAHPNETNLIFACEYMSIQLDKKPFVKLKYLHVWHPGLGPAVFGHCLVYEKLCLPSKWMKKEAKRISRPSIK